jgi:hypothetical protein
MMCGLLTLQQKTDIAGKEYADNMFYNPIQNKANQWVISTQEMDDTTYTQYLWVKSIPIIPFVPK